jgi:undecaprenyl-phosphate 4-deoxy-4-formamido-L-arabinose transferase
MSTCATHLETPPSSPPSPAPSHPACAVSVVVPVFNEEESLPLLFRRLYPVLDGLGRDYEVLFTDDGSSDGSPALLAAQHRARPDVTRVIEFNANYGQHMAVMAAFERARGDVVVTLDADLQNPPEEIPKLLAQTDAGHDCVGGIRARRRDSLFRRHASRLVNFARARMTNIRMTDQGCMLRAYSRAVVGAVIRSGASNTFIPALACSLAHSPVEITVAHEERRNGKSNYSLARLIRLNFDLVTAFTTAPLQLFTLFALACSAGSLLLVLVLAFRRVFLGAEAEGLFTLFGILFFLVSVCMTGIGLIGEYVGRTYQVVRGRARYHISRVLGFPPGQAPSREEKP